MTETQLISRAEAAELLSVSVRTINRYAAAGRLKPYYVNVRGQLVPRYWRDNVLALKAPESNAPKTACH